MSDFLRSIGRLLALVAGCGLLGPMALADGVPPVTLKVKEQESNRFLAQWRVPKLLPPTAIPMPLFPESCHSVGERGLTERAGAWLLRQAYQCDGGLAGQPVGVEYPFPNAAISTLLRVELLSGDRYAHLLAPAERSWRVPDATEGGARAWYREAQQAVLEGVEHFAGHGVHIALVMVFVVLGGIAISVRLATAFAAGQLAAVALFSVSGFRLEAGLAEIGVAAAVALLAREALRPPAERRQLTALAAAAGIVHGSGLAQMVSPAAAAGESIGVFFYVLAVLGMDATLLVAALVGSSLRERVPQRMARGAIATVVVYGIAVAAIALAVGVPATNSRSVAGEAVSGIRLPDLPMPEGATETLPSKRIAASFPDAPLQSFVTVAPFEVRLEVLVRLRELAGRDDREPGSEVEIEAQDAMKIQARDLVGRWAQLTVDRQAIEPADLRVDFLTIGSQGALPRPTPVPEPVDTGWLGVTATYLTDQTPQEVSLIWKGFEAVTGVPATVTDPESSRSVELTERRPDLLWKNELTEDPTPIVSAVAVEPPLIWLPSLSLVLLGTATALGLAALRGARRQLAAALARVTLAGAIVFAPVGNVALPLPLSLDSAPDRDGSKQILARLLPNVYRAFEFPTESATYDRLAQSVTGDTLTETYLEHRRAVRMEERGGAKASIEAVEVVAVETVEPGDPDGFVADASWTVAGTVTHFGHRHFRQNRYEARVTVVPVDGLWKIRSIEILDEERIR